MLAKEKRQKTNPSLLLGSDLLITSRYYTPHSIFQKPLSGDRQQPAISKQDILPGFTSEQASIANLTVYNRSLTLEEIQKLMREGPLSDSSSAESISSNPTPSIEPAPPEENNIDLTQDLKLYFPFTDGSLQDVSRNVLPFEATISLPKVVAGPPGKGDALLFDDFSAGIEIKNSIPLFYTMRSVTIAAFMRTDNIFHGPTIKAFAPHPLSDWLLFGISNSFLVSTFLSSSSNKVNTLSYPLNQSFAADWNHFATTYNPNEAQKLYVNGKLVAKRNASGLLYPDESILFSIRSQLDSTVSTSMFFDEFTMHYRALNETEIRELMKHGPLLKSSGLSMPSVEPSFPVIDPSLVSVPDISSGPGDQVLRSSVPIVPTVSPKPTSPVASVTPAVSASFFARRPINFSVLPDTSIDLSMSTPSSALPEYTSSGSSKNPIFGLTCFTLGVGFGIGLTLFAEHQKKSSTVSAGDSKEPARSVLA